MRILYDHQVFSLQDAGGVSRYVYELVRHLQGAPGVELDVLMGWNASVLPFSSLSDAHTRIVSRKMKGRPGYTRYARNEVLTTALSLAARLRGERYGVYHSMLYRAVPAVPRRRLVVTHHDCTHERFPHLFWNARFIIERKRRLFARADAIICVSESSRQDLLHYYSIDPAKTHVIHHGLSPLPVEEEQTPPANADPYLLYVGARWSYKNFDLLLEAFSRSELRRGYRLLAVGGGPFSPGEQSRIAALGIADRVALLPRVSDAALAAAYSGAALFVYPSRYEGFGFPPLEAMSLGTPVLVNRASSLPEVCGDAGFYFDSADAEELATVLSRTVSDTEGLLLKRSLGPQQASRYSWSRTAEQTLAIYEQCLQG